MPEKPRTPPDERRRLIVTACVCGALLIAAMLLPLAFRRAPESGATGPSRPGGGGEKAALFAAFWTGGDDGPELAVERIGTPDETVSAFCEGTMAQLTARCIDDRGLPSVPPPSGSEYTAVTGEGGSTLRLCRMWLQAQGDWQNWLDVCFDADTGTIYYLYVSRECLSNLSLYGGADRPDAGELAKLLAEDAGGTLRHFVPDANGGGLAVVDAPDGLLCYQIGKTYYDALIDVRISCV